MTDSAGRCRLVAAVCLADRLMGESGDNNNGSSSVDDERVIWTSSIIPRTTKTTAATTTTTATIWSPILPDCLPRGRPAPVGLRLSQASKSLNVGIYVKACSITSAVHCCRSRDPGNHNAAATDAITETPAVAVPTTSRLQLQPLPDTGSSYQSHDRGGSRPPLSAATSSEKAITSHCGCGRNRRHGFSCLLRLCFRHNPIRVASFTVASSARNFTTIAMKREGPERWPGLAAGCGCRSTTQHEYSMRLSGEHPSREQLRYCRFRWGM